MKILLAILVVLMSALPALAQDDFLPTTTYVNVPGSEPREHPLDILRMDLEVSFAPYKGEVSGRVVHSFKVLQPKVDSVVFDAVKIRIKQSTLNGTPARIKQTDKTVTVYCEPALEWDSTGTIAFTFEATPRKGLYFVGWDDTTGRRRRQIWTQGQAFDHRHWIPMYDEMNDKMITTTKITFDTNYRVISNGVLEQNVRNSNGTSTWHYAMSKPHSSYLLMVAIGQYDTTMRMSKSGVPLELYSYPDRPDQIEPTYRQSVEAMDFLEEELGVPYPWSIYRQVPVADYIFGAMENTTATIFGDFYLANEREWLDRSYVRVNVHELTHQWFGDLITGRSRKSLWLQESFATFYPHLMLLQTDGLDAYQWSRRQMQNKALSAGKKDRKPIVHPSAGGNRYYPKGACVIDMMRSTFGVEPVRRVITHYLNHHAFGSVETNDLYLAFQDTLGLTPDWFFDQWLYRGGEPHYSVQTINGIAGDLEGEVRSTIVEVLQIQPVDHIAGYFKMPLSVEVHYSDGSRDSVLSVVKGQYTRITIPNPDNKKVAFVLFDPGSSVLKNVTFKKTWDQLRAQLSQAPYMIDRYDALVALAKDRSHTEELVDVVEEVLDRETFYAMRSQAVKMAVELADKGQAHAYKSIEVGLEDDDEKVRKASIRAMPTIPHRLKGATEALLTDQSYEIIESALQRLGRSFPEEIPSYLHSTQGVTSADQPSPFARVEIARLWLQGSTGDTAALAALADYAGTGHPFWTRRNAMNAFKGLGVLTAAGAESMLDALWSTNGRLAAISKATLTNLVIQTRWKRLLSSVVEAKDLTPRQLKAVKPLLN